jgi:hypothetical protein
LAGLFASATITVSPTGTIVANGALAGSILPYTELSPESLANAVWESLATAHNTAGTMGAFQQAPGGVSTGSTFNHAATGFTLVAGTVTAGSYTVTAPRDGVLHSISSVDPNLDAIYDFQLDPGNVPTAISAYLAVTGNNDAVQVFGYDYAANAWLQIGTIAGHAQATFVEVSSAMYSHMVSSGGLVRVRFYSGNATAAQLHVDQIYVAYGASIVDANITKVNGYTVTGAGTSGSPWGPV